MCVCVGPPVGVHVALRPAVHLWRRLKRGVTLLHHGALGMTHSRGHKGTLRGRRTSEPAVRLLSYS